MLLCYLFAVSSVANVDIKEYKNGIYGESVKLFKFSDYEIDYDADSVAQLCFVLAILKQAADGSTR